MADHDIGKSKVIMVDNYRTSVEFYIGESDHG